MTDGDSTTWHLWSFRNKPLVHLIWRGSHGIFSGIVPVVTCGHLWSVEFDADNPWWQQATYCHTAMRRKLLQRLIPLTGWRPLYKLEDILHIFPSTSACQTWLKSSSSMILQTTPPYFSWFLFWDLPAMLRFRTSMHQWRRLKRATPKNTRRFDDFVLWFTDHDFLGQKVTLVALDGGFTNEIRRLFNHS